MRNLIKHNDPQFVVVFEKTNEEWEIGTDTRHGKKGFRVIRYIKERWDEHYMFFTSLDAALLAFKTNDLTEGRQAF